MRCELVFGIDDENNTKASSGFLLYTHNNTTSRLDAIIDNIFEKKLTARDVGQDKWRAKALMMV